MWDPPNGGYEELYLLDLLEYNAGDFHRINSI
jgi:hypothetical protein